MSTESKYYSRDIFHFEEYVAKIDKSRFDILASFIHLFHVLVLNNKKYDENMRIGVA
jgi:hypothetical protein